MGAPKRKGESRSSESCKWGTGTEEGTEASHVVAVAIVVVVPRFDHAAGRRAVLHSSAL